MKSLKGGMLHRRICADFHEDRATEIDLLEVQIGIHRATKSKSDRDRILCDTALLALESVIDAYRALIGEKYPLYEDIVEFLKSGQMARLIVEPHVWPSNKHLTSDATAITLEATTTEVADGLEDENPGRPG